MEKLKKNTFVLGFFDVVITKSDIYFPTVVLSFSFFCVVKKKTLPANLAVPWTGIANYLGLSPVVCHAAVVLWNYRLLDLDGPIDLRYH